MSILNPKTWFATKPRQLMLAPDIQQRLETVRVIKAAQADVQAVHPDFRKLAVSRPARRHRAYFFDPLSLNHAMGFRHRRYSLSYDLMKKVTAQLDIIAAILATRLNQIRSFAQPWDPKVGMGFWFKHVEHDKVLTRNDLKNIKELVPFVRNTGFGQRTDNRKGKRRDNFESFLVKFGRDSLTYDQGAFEVIPSKLGSPYEFTAVDGATVRIAATLDEKDQQALYDHLNSGAATQYIAEEKPDTSRPDGPVSYVQVINGQLRQVFAENELAFCIRNPRTDVYAQGYGYAEIEQIISTITGALHGEEYNRRFFLQGSTPKGFLNLKDDELSPEQLEGFRRQFHAMLAGVENAWRTPIFRAEKMEWVDLHRSNRDMEYNEWMKFLIRMITAVYLIDPAEINHDMGGVNQQPLFEKPSEWKLKHSRDKGLRPFLRFIASCINEHVLNELAPEYELVFLGLDEPDEKDRLAMAKDEVQYIKTFNEVRKEYYHLAAVPGGDVIANPVFMQSYQAAQMEQQQQEQPQEGEEGSQDTDFGNAETDEDGNVIPDQVIPLLQQGDTFEESPENETETAEKSVRKSLDNGAIDRVISDYGLSYKELTEQDYGPANPP